MMMNEEFLMMLPGSMGSLSFFVHREIRISDKHKQDFIDRQTREMSSTFNPPPGLSPDQYSELFLNHYIKSRQSSRDQLEKVSSMEIRQEILVQVGNFECLQEAKTIQAHPDFIRWENPYLAEQFLHGK